MSNCPGPQNRYTYNLITFGSKVYVVGGSRQVLDIWHVDLSTGLDTTSCNSWTIDYNNNVTSTTFGPYIYGVGFKLNGGSSIYIQAGDTNVGEMAFLKNFDTSINRISTTNYNAGFINLSRMTATVDSNNNVWFYGGRTMLGLSGASENQTIQASNSYINYNIINNGVSSKTVSDSKPYGERPGRFGHTATIVNNKIFMLGGYTLLGGKDTIFELDSAQVFDITTQKTISMATIGDIPIAKTDFSTVPANDGHSIILFGGYNNDGQNTISSDVYILDTCKLTWQKKNTTQSVQPRAGHQAFMYGQYMITLLGASFVNTTTSIAENNFAILDTNSWTWVTSIPSGYQAESNSINQQPSCSFSFPVLPTTDQSNGDASKIYDKTVISNPNSVKWTEELTTPEKAGIGVGVPLFVLLLLGIGIFFFIRRRNLRKNRQLNPRWMPGVFGNQNNNNQYPPPHLNGTSSIPLSTTTTPSSPSSPSSPPTVIRNQPTGLKTYTATDLDQWERQLIQDKDHPQSNERTEARHTELWNKFRGDLAPDVERR